MDLFAIVGVCFVLIAAWPFVRQRRRRRWVRQGRCLHCGYSIRGVPSPQCPECGKSTQADLAENRRLLHDNPFKHFRWP